MSKLFKWIIGFAGTMLVAWSGSFFYDRTKDIPVLNYFTGGLRWIYDLGTKVLNFPIKVWVIVVSLLVINLVIALYRRLKDSAGGHPDFVGYKMDVFKKWIWRWDWRYEENGWKVVSLIPYCPKDDVQLINNSDIFNVRFYCPKCNTEFGEYREPLEYSRDAEILILDKVNKKAFEKRD
ncbi:hypothetical protein [Chitinophaga barathri]|uniref:Uncharacterized protein n=1 Tax=Chitinophaga barathri TaxID=1647451 RepID=A0A3N4MA34_9BACT|nr:hypothetical protein [Chitinophaga barathri]RPD40602.1 hypothetical protein EG028_14990 [Chitinophaga barathri]